VKNHERIPRPVVTGYNRLGNENRVHDGHGVHDAHGRQGSFELKLTGPAVTFIAGAIVVFMGLVAARLAGGG
jgi:hypothetical protein